MKSFAINLGLVIGIIIVIVLLLKRSRRSRARKILAMDIQRLEKQLGDEGVDEAREKADEKLRKKRADELAELYLIVGSKYDKFK